MSIGDVCAKNVYGPENNLIILLRVFEKIGPGRWAANLLSSPTEKIALLGTLTLWRR